MKILESTVINRIFPDSGKMKLAVIQITIDRRLQARMEARKLARGQMRIISRQP